MNIPMEPVCNAYRYTEQNAGIARADLFMCPRVRRIIVHRNLVGWDVWKPALQQQRGGVVVVVVVVVVVGNYVLF